MSLYRLECSMVVPRPLEDVFSIYESPLNLARITPTWLRFTIAGNEEVLMREGARINYTIRWLGLPMRWRTHITAYDPPHRFVDEQERGPYAYWKHTHTFGELPEGVLVADSVDYRLPLGPFGRLAHSLAVGKQLIAIFRYRQSAIARIFDVPLVERRAPAISRVRAHTSI